MQYVLKLMSLLPLIPKYWHDRWVPWQLDQMFTCFLRLHAITVSTHAIFCVPIYALTVTWITSTLWLLWIILLWTLMSKPLPEYLLSFVLCVSRREISDHKGNLCLTSWATAVPFSTADHHFISPPSVFKAPVFPYLHQDLQFSMAAFGMGVNWYLTVV